MTINANFEDHLGELLFLGFPTVKLLPHLHHIFTGVTVWMLAFLLQIFTCTIFAF